MAKNKPTMEKQPEWLQDLELKLRLVHQQLVLLGVTRPELGDPCQKLNDIIHDVNNKRTVAQNWEAVAEQNGFVKNAE